MCTVISGAGETVGGESLDMNDMVGHILDIKCPCGYSTTVTPRSELSKEGSAEYVIAYNVSPPDDKNASSAETTSEDICGDEEGTFIDTVEREEVERRQLKIIENPWLDHEAQFNTPWDDGWGDYLCPKCEKISLRIYPAGHIG